MTVDYPRSHQPIRHNNEPSARLQVMFVLLVGHFLSLLIRGSLLLCKPEPNLLESPDKKPYTLAVFSKRVEKCRNQDLSWKLFIRMSRILCLVFRIVLLKLILHPVTAAVVVWRLPQKYSGSMKCLVSLRWLNGNYMIRMLLRKRSGIAPKKRSEWFLADW